MVHVSLYADETYMDDGYIFMGGYVASVDEWLRLIAPWNEILVEHPKVPYFSNHGFKSEQWCLDNQVVDTHLLPEKALKLARLVAGSNIYFAAHSRLWKSHFERAIKSRVLALRKPKYELLRDPYYFAYVRLVSLLIQEIPKINAGLPEQDALSPVDVFVDENGKLAEEATKLYLFMKREADEKFKPLMGKAAPLDDKETVPLQCADLLLGQLRELYLSGTVTEALQILRTRRFRPMFTDRIVDWTLPKLQEFAEKMKGLPANHWLR